MLVLNFSHRLSNAAIEKLKEMVGDYVNEEDPDIAVLDLKLKVDFSKSLTEQIVSAVNEVETGSVEPRGSEDCRNLRFDDGRVFIISPGISDAAILLSVEIHGRLGEYPHLILMKKEEGTKQFLPYEILDCSKLRSQARGRNWRYNNPSAALP